MTEDINSIKHIIVKYIETIKNNNIGIDQVYLFGSYSKGTATIDSDIDVAIISSDFLGDRFEDRNKIVPLRRKIDRRLEPMPFRPEDFHIYNPLAIEIIRNGIRLL
jgi:uncharacterized protein